MTGTFSIRPAEAADAAALTRLALRSKASNGYDEAFMRACEAELTYTALTIAGGDTWVAEDADGRLLGFFDLRPQGDGAEVFAMFVEPGAKRSGLGRALWAKLEDCARRRGIARIGLDSDPNAVAFYSAMGMRITGSSPSGSIPGRFLPRMEKAIG
ncbi:MAG: GNAT family N-acetyltransferase [Parvibaculaceae bacterium]